MPRQITANTAAVATGHPLGAAAGLEALDEGGNAIDAAVAAMLAMCVVVPGSVGIGGYGGSAVIHLGRTGETVSIDFDSRAPVAFREGIVTADKESNYYGAKAVTVPAVVAGLNLILLEYGRYSWSSVSQPAIRLAEDGFEFDSEHQRYWDRCAPKFDGASIKNLFGSDGAPGPGGIWRQPDLAKLLRQLAEDGPESFYDGEIAESIVRYLGERGGILGIDDFRSYRPRVDEPVVAGYRECMLYTSPPPSGGVTSLGIVQTMERVADDAFSPWSGEYFHLLAEVMKLCWQERHTQLGDPDFVGHGFKELVSEDAAKVRSQRVVSGTVVRCQSAADQSPHTANVISIDGEGNMVSLTATQGWMYGSHLVVDGMGLVLNHGMSRFDYVAGHPNAPLAGKRMQHNMAPMIALRGGKPAYAFGLPGGPKIVSVTAQLALDTIGFGATPAASIAAPRLHTDGSEPVWVSDYMDAEVVADLEKRGHEIRREADMGGPVNVLAVDRQTGKIDIASGETIGAVGGL